MVAYNQLARKDATPSSRSATFDEIETAIEFMFKSEHEQETNKRKLTKDIKRGLSTASTSVKEAFEARRETSWPTTLRATNDWDVEINVEAMPQPQLSHRGFHQEQAFLDREVEQSLLA
jgi:hypothetical protein